MRLLPHFLLSLSVFLVLSACSPDPKKSETGGDMPQNEVAARVFSEGQHYSVLSHPVLEPHLEQYLTEYFWLGCPHCQNFEPVLKGYLSENPQVTLVRKHPALGERWAIDGSIFYGLELNGYSHLIDALFALYWQMRTEMNSLPDRDTINAFLKHHSIDPDHFTELLKSEAIQTAMEQANREMLDNRISGVPSLVVNGKYLVSGNQPADIKSVDDYYQLIDYLLSKK